MSKPIFCIGTPHRPHKQETDDIRNMMKDYHVIFYINSVVDFKCFNPSDIPCQSIEEIKSILNNFKA